ncbi:MAG: 3-phosphoglycerate dehydrogenase, partial [Flavobacteriales bacterium]|nr:3-phosphoglycerate dehydrogenase [Flavobacteriales bacterium]
CGMNVIYTDPFAEKATVNVTVGGQKIAIELTSSSKEEVLAKADFVSLHVPKLNQPAIGIEEFAIMKDGVIIVNAARGGVVDEDALITNLNSGKVAHAALDVFENEPTPREDLLKHPKISLTPHIGAATLEAQDRIGEELASQIKALLL